MKITFNSIVKTGVVAVALACAGASQAATSYTHTYNAGGQVSDTYGKTLTSTTAGSVTQGVAVYTMTSATNPSDSLLAFCIEPGVKFNGDASYTGSGFTVSNAVKALFETSYATLATKDSKISFQLALWDLMYDDGKMFATTGAQFFSAQSNTRLSGAQTMLDLAAAHTTLSNNYSYTVFTGAANGVGSQTLLGASVAAVPEADSWAMMAAGLALVGFIGRRKSTRSAKFA